MPAVLITIGNLAVDGREALQAYASFVLPMLKEAGGELLFRGGPIATLVGLEPPDLIFVMRFADEETIRQVLGSEEYLRLVSYRNQAFTRITTVIAKEFEA